MRPIGALLCRASGFTTGYREARDAAPNIELQTQERNHGFRAIASRTNGVFVFRMRDECRVDHAVIEDANAGIIADSEGTDALLLSAKKLQRCGGLSTQKLRIEEVRVVQRIEEKRTRGQSYTEVDEVIYVNGLPTAKGSKNS